MIPVFLQGTYPTTAWLLPTMAEDDPEVEIITSPRKVANIRRLSAIRQSARPTVTTVNTTKVGPRRRTPPTQVEKGVLGRLRASAAARSTVTFRRLPGQKQAVLAFGRPKTLAKQKSVGPSSRPNAGSSSRPNTKPTVAAKDSTSAARKRHALPSTYESSESSSSDSDDSGDSDDEKDGAASKRAVSREV